MSVALDVTRPSSPAARSRGRLGFTLIEILISLVILAFVLTGMGRFVGGFLHSVGTSTARSVAAAVAREQIEAIRTDPSYPLRTSWASTVTGFPGYPSMRRITVLNRVTSTSPSRDYTIVTVKVTEPTMIRTGYTSADTVNATAAIAKP